MGSPTAGGEGGTCGGQAVGAIVLQYRRPGALQP